MALRTIKDVKSLGRFPVFRSHQNQRGNVSSEATQFIHLDDEKNTITLKIQDGSTFFPHPKAKLAGVNGCGVLEISDLALKMVEFLDKEVPCEENKAAIDGLKTAVAALTARNDRMLKAKMAKAVKDFEAAEKAKTKK